MDEKTLQKALQVGRFGEDGMMPAGELITVLLAMSSSSHADTIASMFPVTSLSSIFLNHDISSCICRQAFVTESVRIPPALVTGLVIPACML